VPHLVAASGSGMSMIPLTLGSARFFVVRSSLRGVGICVCIG
jgi:hypothetical protein